MNFGCQFFQEKADTFGFTALCQVHLRTLYNEKIYLFKMLGGYFPLIARLDVCLNRYSPILQFAVVAGSQNTAQIATCTAACSLVTTFCNLFASHPGHFPTVRQLVV